MKKIEVSKLPTEHLIEKTRTLSAERMRAIYAGKPKDGNRMYDLLIAINRELRARGMEAQRQLLALLDDKDLGTRCWAAITVMEFAPDDGEKVLADLAKIAGGWLAFRRSGRWRSGKREP